MTLGRPAPAPEPSTADLPHLRDAVLHPIRSIWDHRAGNPSTNPADAACLDGALIIGTATLPPATRARQVCPSGKVGRWPC